MLDGFVSETIQANGVGIRVSRAGSGPPLLLGHGAIPGARLVPPRNGGEDVGGSSISTSPPRSFTMRFMTRASVTLPAYGSDH